MKQSTIGVYNEGYIDEIQGYEVFVGGGLDCEQAKELATDNFIRKGITACLKEGRVDARGQNHGVVTKMFIKKRTFKGSYCSVTGHFIKFLFMVHWESKNLVFMLHIDK